MLQLDETYWSQRYEAGQTHWDLRAISTPLKTYFDQLQNKNLRILIPGAGNSYEAEYLAKQGFTDVTVCDLSDAPLNSLRKRLKNNPALHLLKADFFTLTGRYDLIVEQTFFCAIDPTLRKDYFAKMNDLLKPGGKLVGVLFDDKLNDDRPPFGGSLNEYLGYIPDRLKKVVFERCYNSIAPRAGRELFMLLEKALP